MKHTKNILLAEFLACLIFSLLVVVLYETDLLLPGWRSGNTREEFTVAVVMELLTICGVPSALYMFRLKVVARKLREGKEHSMLLWGSLRMLLLCLPMAANVLFYYWYGELPSFGYMAIVLFLSSLFIFPSMDRCLKECDIKA